MFRQVLTKRNWLQLTIKRRLNMQSPSDIISKTLNNAGIIILNRPEALNSFTVSIFRDTLMQLQEWHEKKTVIILKGAGNKAFSAGGDLSIMSNKERGPESVRAGYLANYLIGKSQFKFISFLDGIAMGAGLVVPYSGKYSIATENTVIAMPETRVGLYPDVGGTYMLPKIKNKLGFYLGLTGNSLRGSDAVHAGLATYFVPSQRLPELEKQLSHCTENIQIDPLINKFSAPLEKFSLADNLQHINYCFSGQTIEEIIQRLKTIDNEWSSKTIKILHQNCPGSLKIALRALQYGSYMSRADSAKMEYRITLRAIHSHDFSEGVRAVLIEKDFKPRWNPRTLDEVTNDYVGSFFEKLPDDKELDVD